MSDSSLVPFFFEDETKLKIHSDIAPPLKSWVVFQESLLPLLIFNRFQYSSSQYSMDASLHALVDLLYLLFWYLQLTCFLVPDYTMNQKSFWRQFFIYYLYSKQCLKTIHTGKSFSEAFILAWINPQYEKRLFIELQL